MSSQDWLAELRARVERLEEPLRLYGLQQVAEAQLTLSAYPGSAQVIWFELTEEVVSLEFTNAQILAVSDGKRQALMEQVRLTLWH